MEIPFAGLLELFVQPLMTDHKLRLSLGVTPQVFTINIATSLFVLLIVH